MHPTSQPEPFPSTDRSSSFHLTQTSYGPTRRYEIADDHDGRPGAVLAVADTPALRLRGRMTLYTDPSRERTLAELAEIDTTDLATAAAGGYRVTDEAGAEIGSFSRDLRASLTRTTWHLRAPGLPDVVGQERSRTIAGVRRLWKAVDLVVEIPLPFTYHFDFAGPDGPVLHVDKTEVGRDRYVVRVADPRWDQRLLFAMAVALDAMQGR